MPDHDQLFHGATPDGGRISIAVSEGTITALGTHLAGSAREETDFGEDILIPGWIDAHVHFNEPGRDAWEGLHTGSLALAAGGGTSFIDMPLNSSPPVCTAGDFEAKRRIATEKSHLDFALWGGLIPSSIPHLHAMADAGAAGFKAFMCDSGLDEFPAADAATLKAGMTTAAELGLPVAVHAELPFEVPVNGRDMRAWLDSRPIDFELNAIRLVLDLAGETGCALHIVHVTCAEGIDLVTDAKSRGVDVTVETCPHYLLLDENDAIRIGAAAKCAPPIRSAGHVAALWTRLLNGQIDTIGSDHSPAPPEMKRGDDLFAIWGGIAGIQHGLPLLLSKSTAILPQISANVAARFRLPGKGMLAPGGSADFAVLRANSKTIRESSLLTRHRISPYIDMTPSLAVTSTWLRGERVTAHTRGRFLKPTRI
jgi:allantoinase